MPGEPGRAPFGAGQDHVDRVLADPRVARGDEHLRPLDPVDAGIIGREGPGGDVAHVGAGVRLGQAHGPLPVAARASSAGTGPGRYSVPNRIIEIRRAAGELDIGGERRTGRRVHLVDHLVEDERHPPFDAGCIRCSNPSRWPGGICTPPRIPGAGVTTPPSSFTRRLSPGALIGATTLRAILYPSLRYVSQSSTLKLSLNLVAGEHLRGGQPFLDDELQIPGVVTEIP